MADYIFEWLVIPSTEMSKRGPAQGRREAETIIPYPALAERQLHALGLALFKHVSEFT